MPALIIKKNGTIVRIVRLPEGETRIGRAAGNALVLDSATASRAHALVLRRGSFVTVRDLQSTNGTAVNQALISLTPLLDGDVVHIADHDILYLAGDVASAETLPERPAPVPDHAAETAHGALAGLEAGKDASGQRIGGPRGARWVGDGVAFTLLAQGREIEVIVTSDALRSHFGAGLHAADEASRALMAYEENHVTINVAAWARYGRDRREPVVVRASDFAL